MGEPAFYQRKADEARYEREEEVEKRYEDMFSGKSDRTRRDRLKGVK